jgi:hypothetical protein
MRTRIRKLWRWLFPRLRCPQCNNWASRKNRALYRHTHVILECECGHVDSVIAWSDPNPRHWDWWII